MMLALIRFVNNGHVQNAMQRLKSILIWARDDQAPICDSGTGFSNLRAGKRRSSFSACRSRQIPLRISPWLVTSCGATCSISLNRPLKKIITLNVILWNHSTGPVYQMNSLANKISAITSLPDVLAKLSSLTISGWVITIILFLWFLANRHLPLLLDFIERKERRRLEQLDIYISSTSSADANVMKVIRDTRDSYYFRIATGINASSCFRNALIRLHEEISHAITWRQIARSIPYLKVADNKRIFVRHLSTGEKLGYLYNQFVAYGLLLFSAIAFGLLILSNIKTPVSLFAGLGSGILSVFAAMFVFSQNWPIDASKKKSPKNLNANSLRKPIT